jgi:putative two-component system response regulator
MEETNTKPKKILIADDSKSDAEILQQLLNGNGYISMIASNGIDAIETAIKEFPDLVLLDVDMPGENGYAVARQLKSFRSTRLVPIIMLTALSELGAKLEGLEAGVDDYITKPYRPIELLARIRSLLRVKALSDQLDDAESIIFTLARIIEAKDSYTLGHADRVSRFAVALGKLLGRTAAELETLDKGGVLHDIGKMAIPDAILLKPGSLTREEFDIMKTHPVVGCTICERLRSAKDALPLIRHHHEKLDGTGYPDGLKKNEIPLLVRIVNVVDIYDALTTRRSYKDAWSIDRTFSVMYEEVKRGWWDGDLLRTWEKFVRSGEIQAILPKDILKKSSTIT